MPHTLTETSTFNASITVPEPGEDATAQSLEDAVQPLANRTQYLQDEIDVISSGSFQKSDALLLGGPFVMNSTQTYTLSADSNNVDLSLTSGLRNHIVINPSADGFSITGIVPYLDDNGDPVVGQRVILSNGSTTNSFNLLGGDARSSNANKFQGGTGRKIVGPGEIVEIIYTSANTGRWAVEASQNLHVRSIGQLINSGSATFTSGSTFSHSGSSGEGYDHDTYWNTFANLRNPVLITDHFLHQSGSFSSINSSGAYKIGALNWSIQTNHTNTPIGSEDSTAQHPGVVLLITNAISGTLTRIYQASDLSTLSISRVRAVIKTNTSISDTQYVFGLASGMPSDPLASTRQALFLYNPNIDGQWQTRIKGSGAPANISSAFTVATNSWYVLELRITVTSGTPVYQFFINDTMVAQGTESSIDTSTFDIVFDVRALTASAEFLRIDRFDIMFQDRGQAFT